MTKHREQPRFKQPYGSRWSELHPEAYRIWTISEQEPEESPRYGVAAMYELEDEIDKAAVMASEIWAHAQKLLTPRELLVMQMRIKLGMTLQEVGDRIFVGPERVRQLETAGVRRLKAFLAKSHLKSLRHMPTYQACDV